MGYLSCRAESSIATCRSISSFSPSPAALRSSKSSSTPQCNDCNGTVDGDVHSHRIRHFTYQELESATGNFSEHALLGRGSHGAVYRAVLRGGRQVAVKRPSRRPPSHLASPSPTANSLVAAARDEVDNEIAILSGIRSPRLVNLIGFTPSNSGHKERLLVVEFMPNGTLYDFLHSNPRQPGWARRLRLALQTAKALLTLHSARPPIIHRDVKSANVLIDHNFNARLGDFGLALRDEDDVEAKFFFSARSIPPAGTLGYLDPSYVTPENLSTKTDVFSFGILLLEIMSGRKAIDIAHSPPSVVEWAVPLLRKGKVSALFDPRIAPPKDPAARRQLTSLAASCVRSCKERRPSMEEVVEQLKALSKTVPSRAWNGLVVGNPCSVVDTERTLSKLKLNSPSSGILDLSLSSMTRLNGGEEPSATEEEETPACEMNPPMMVKATRPLKNTRKVFSDGGTRGSRNLVDLMARTDGELISEGDSGTSISRARTVRVACDYYDRDTILQLRRNQSVSGVPKLKNPRHFKEPELG